MLTRASSINRALDQIGDKWCLLIIQEMFWGINTFTGLAEATGASRGVLADRLRYLQRVDCLIQVPGRDGGRRLRYRLTPKSLDTYPCALMALNWERRFFNTPDLDRLQLTHAGCNSRFRPRLRSRCCGGEILADEVDYQPGPGAARDEREKKVRRRSSVSLDAIPSRRYLYRNLINIVGDRWTANIIALAFHGLARFDEFHRELPVATNILADRLRFLVGQGIFTQVRYSERPPRHAYRLTPMGEATFPWFLALLQWGDRWCDPEGLGPPVIPRHRPCGQALLGEVVCSNCGGPLLPREVDFTLGSDRNLAGEW